MSRWFGSRVRLTWMEEFGIWQVLDRDGEWQQIRPMETVGLTLAKLGYGDRLWVRQRDLTRLADQQETLFP